ncbi:PTS IIA-like nitrogen regulatory protein PtsN [Phreatobacter sp. AB_2022a]|uniref:PTS IIA-like nitrogen regulatory protein PtsN n=1 Tax=Phreatobacter sp. AB_2022a TaxID=3003134 RepID=UPI002287169F|nr:PTS IIA-like nitrogen regulatory protein PtsN [Phreatobacter sp. AB_2022a]MCZ0737357.1 PTS IIA-like nitrogen regulatory protein PtsN [Phreatobacter sp. AB_2022a]
MPIHDIIAAGAIIPSLHVDSKKQLLQEIAAKAAELTGRDAREIYETLNDRERLGSTGAGGGIAIPHGKLPKLTRMTGLFARLDRPVDFDAIDGQPVDLVFALLAPEGAGADHLKALSRIARLTRDPAHVQKLRSARDEATLRLLLAQPVTSNAA